MWSWDIFGHENLWHGLLCPFFCDRKILRNTERLLDKRNSSTISVRKSYAVRQTTPSVGCNHYMCKTANFFCIQREIRLSWCALFIYLWKEINAQAVPGQLLKVLNAGAECMSGLCSGLFRSIFLLFFATRTTQLWLQARHHTLQLMSCTRVAAEWNCRCKACKLIFYHQAATPYRSEYARFPRIFPVWFFCVTKFAAGVL